MRGVFRLVFGIAALWSGSAAGALAADPNDVLPADPAKAVVVRACTSCHQAPVIVAKRRSADDWDDVVGRMMDRGARASDAEQQQITDYLAKHFGAKPAGGQPGK